MEVVEVGGGGSNEESRRSMSGDEVVSRTASGTLGARRKTTAQTFIYFIFLQLLSVLFWNDLIIISILENVLRRKYITFTFMQSVY